LLVVLIEQVSECVTHGSRLREIKLASEYRRPLIGRTHGDVHATTLSRCKYDTRLLHDVVRDTVDDPALDEERGAIALDEIDETRHEPHPTPKG